MDNDFRFVSAGDARVEDAQGEQRAGGAEGLGEDVAGCRGGAIQANVLENIRPMVIAGFAKLVELVKKQAASMQAPTAAGPDCCGASGRARR